MLVPPEDLQDFKKWAIQKLEQGNKTDADADVLADYIIALLNADEPARLVRVNLESNLKDFVHHGAAEFSDEIMRVVDQKAYKATSSSFAPDYLQEQPSVESVADQQPQSIQAQQDTRFSDQSANQSSSRRRFAGPSAGSNQSRKRGYYDRDIPEQFAGGMSPGDDRAKKFPRRGGRANSRGRQQQQSATYSPSMPAEYPPLQYHPGSNPPSSGGKSYYGNPDTSSLPDDNAALPYSQSFTASSNSLRPRCRDYDNKGFCTRGSDCPYDHSDTRNPPINHIPNMELLTQHVMRNPGAFSPAALANIFSAMAKAVGDNAGSPFSASSLGTSFNEGGHGGRSRFQSRHRGNDDNSNRGGRSAFSLVGAPQSRTNTTLVVENIPKDHYSESEIRDYFQRFGTIVQITMPSSAKTVALLEFADREAAEKAWHSPDAVFGNRFVKVFWSKAGDEGADSSNRRPRENHRKQNPKFGRNAQRVDLLEDQDSSQVDEPKPDPMEVEQRIAEAQRVHEEKLQKAAEAKEKLAEVEEKLKSQNEEKKKLLAMIAAKQKKKTGGMGIDGAEESSMDVESGVEPNQSDGNEEAANSADEELKARLKMLEAEAQSLGIDPNRPFPFSGFRGRGRGGAFRGRGRGSFRGAFGGAFRGGAAPGAVMRLDNRPKKIAVIGVKSGTPTDEAVRRFLLNKFEKHDIEPHPERDDSQIISFAERYMAELFIEEAPRELNPEVGKLELKWFTGPSSSPSTAETGAAQVSAAVDLTAQEHIDAADNNNNEESKSTNHLMDTAGAGFTSERDLDVADDDDRWM